VLNFLAQDAEIGAFLQGLGKANHDQLSLLCKSKASDRVALLVYVETAILIGKTNKEIDNFTRGKE
jgi:hypothetical protein